MNKFTYLEKIEKKQTKISLTVSNASPHRDEFVDLILKGLIIGGSTNCLKQVGLKELEKSDFHAVQRAQNEFSKIFYKLVDQLGDKLNDVKPQTHRFY